MQATTISLCLFVVVALISSFKSCVSRRDTITFSSSLQDDGTTIVSARKSFELGFFNPEDKNNAERYVGIWYYNLRLRTVVWIANRNEPLLDGTGVFTIFKDGNLQLLDENGTSYFHTKLESSSYDNRTLQLLDSGNLALIDGRSGYYLWQSFEEPTDTFLPGMKMDENLKLVSWMDPGNPKIGNYTFQQNQDDNTVYMIMNRTILHWRSDATGSDELENRVTFMLSNFSRRDKPDTNISSKKRRDISYGAKINPSSFYYSDTRLLMNSSGEIQFYRKQQHGWSLIWSEPHDACAVNDPCGNFGICNLKNKVSACECLPGFAAVFPDSWKTGDFTGGCVRKSAICDKNSKPDIFLNLKFMKVGKPDLYYAGAESEDKCRYECLNNCKTKCQAYYYAEPNRILRRGTENAEANCLIWTSDLNNLQEYYDGGHNLSIRVAVAAIGSTSRDCESCGKYIIPYPLSSGPSCGDPSYHSFSCNDSTGQLFFLTMNNSDEVIYINKEEQRFVIQINRRGAENCSARTSVETVLQLNQSMPFNVTNWCYNKSLTFSHEPSIQDGQRIEIGWKPPSEPICNSFNDCEDWPNSNCSASKRCLCYPNYRWDNLSLMCKSAVLSPSQTSTKPSVSMNHEAIIIVTTVIAVVLVAGSVSCFLYRRRILAKMEERKGSTPPNPVPPMDDSERKANEIVVEDDKIVDVPYFSLESILAATDNFSDANKLGRGGFGPVYKGIFPGEKEIAIKRLSSHSVQGLVEFRNEVILIAKLQHRNLVRLLGYCIKGSEKILLYEYMLNKSLDTFIFDQGRCGLLDWNRRFDIILGIARGLLYLHQDSRLRIIHRDLKTSNILLDEEMNPKISDFGLARIVEGKETEANTMKIVGTYGYMSPEYAAEGLFSTKSDVFSFGVILFEIISGKRNTGFYQSKEALSLLGYAWKLWQERNVMGFVDKEILESCNGTEVMKCINIGLLCVEEDPSDRPTMSNVLTMLSSETTTLPSPNQPAFVARRRTISTSTSLTSKEETNSINEITISAEEGR